MLSIVVRTIGQNFFLLNRAIESIIDNTFKEKQIIVVYQGVDLEVFCKIKASLSIFDDEVNMSFIHNNTLLDERSKNLNLGLGVVKGKYLAFLDDDDYLERNHYQNLINALNKNEATLAYSLAKIVGEDNKEKAFPFKGRYLDKISMLKDNFITIHSFVLSLEKISLDKLSFNENLVLAEDYVFILPIYLFEKIVFVKEKTASYFIKEEESKSFIDSNKSNLRKNQRALMKSLRKEFKISLLEKIKLHIKRLFGLTPRA